MLVLTLFLTGVFLQLNAEKLYTTEVFEIVIDPSLFNWTYEGDPEQFEFRPTLVGFPDLPSWMNYQFSSKYHTGFIYGTVPKTLPVDSHIQIEVTGFNRKVYEVRRLVIPVYITKKVNAARNEAQFKINNMNVEDMFDAQRMERLKNVFRHVLWKESQNDLYVTFLASAIDFGARLPLSPTDGEGVIIKVGSQAVFSHELLQLEKEVRPLWKHTSCPRDFKRTSVERYFRESGFALDWCTFVLLEDNGAPLQHFSNNLDKPDDIEELYQKDLVPIRSYASEIVISLLIPLILLVLFSLFLSLILCVEHEKLYDECSEIFFANLFHIVTDSFSRFNTTRSTENYLTLSSSTVRPEKTIGSLNHDLSNSSATLQRNHNRPSPPPYVKPPQYKANL